MNQMDIPERSWNNMHFHSQVVWQPATYDVISRKDSNCHHQTCLKMCATPPPPHLTPLYVQGLSEVPDQFVSLIRGWEGVGSAQLGNDNVSDLRSHAWQELYL